MKIMLIRHAEPDYANDTITEAGHLEAQALAQLLHKEGLDRVYSSPIDRAVHTMRYTAELLGVEPVMEPWTRELDWQADAAQGGKIAAWNTPGEIVRAPETSPDLGSWQTLPQYREYVPLYDELAAASDDFISRHGYKREIGRYRIQMPNQETIAVFCHLGFGLTWLSHLLELPAPLVWSGFWLPPSSVTTIVFEERSEEWAVPRCIGLGSVSHLYKAGLPISRFGLIANKTE